MTTRNGRPSVVRPDLLHAHAGEAASSAGSTPTIWRQSASLRSAPGAKPRTLSGVGTRRGTSPGATRRREGGRGRAVASGPAGARAGAANAPPHLQLLAGRRSGRPSRAARGRSGVMHIRPRGVAAEGAAAGLARLHRRRGEGERLQAARRRLGLGRAPPRPSAGPGVELPGVAQARAPARRGSGRGTARRPSGSRACRSRGSVRHAISSKKAPLPAANVRSARARCGRRGARRARGRAASPRRAASAASGGRGQRRRGGARSGRSTCPRHLASARGAAAATVRQRLRDRSRRGRPGARATRALLRWTPERRSSRTWSACPAPPPLPPRGRRSGSPRRSRRPTRAQELGLGRRSRPARSTLVFAPTGSGKTLAAFLAAIDRLMFAPVPPTGASAAASSTSRRCGAGGGRGAQPARAARGHRARGGAARRRVPPARVAHPHRRHARGRARAHAPPAARHPDHDPGVAVPGPHLAGARDPGARSRP